MRLRGAASVLAIAASGLALVPAGAPATAAHQANSRLSASACYLLYASVLQGAVTEGAHPLVGGPLGNACLTNSCWNSEVNPETGGKQCSYARGALLTLSRMSRPSAAQGFVRSYYSRGYKRVSIRHATAAGITSDASGAGVVMAVGSTTVLLTAGAKGLHETHIPWAGSKALVLRAAAQVAGRLSKQGCPLNTNACA